MWRSERLVLAPGFLEDPPGTMEALLDRLHLERVTQARFIEVGGKEYWLKYTLKSHPFALKTLFHVTGPWRTPERLVEYRNFERLRAAGLLAPRPVAFAEERRFGVMTVHLLMAERVPGAVDLQAILARGDLPEDRVVDLLFAAGDAVGRMHRAGFLHRDLFTRNLLVTGEPGRDAKIWFIDCRKGSWSRFAIYGHGYDLGAFDLWAATCAPQAARVAFFAAYARAARPRSIERLLASAERNRREQVRRFFLRRAAEGAPLKPARDVPPLDPEAIRRFEPSPLATAAR